MRIVVNNIAASSGGAMTVLKDFYKCVTECDKENEWIFLLNQAYFEETENVRIITLPEIKKSARKKIMFDFFTGKKYIKALKPDVVFSMQNLITFGLKVPQIVYLHQSIPFQSAKKYSLLRRRERKLAFIQHILGFFIKRSVKRADAVIVQTAWMKEAVTRICRVPESKIHQIPPNVKDISTFRQDGVFDQTHFFYPTAVASYKNNACIFAACEELQKEGIPFHVTLTLPKEMSRPGIDCIGRIPYEEVLDHYNKSTLIFPSYIETFGYPLVEGRQMGTVVLASSCAFSKELLLGYENAYLFDPFKSEELACLMKRVISGEICKKETSPEASETENTWKKVLNAVVSLKGDLR